MFEYEFERNVLQEQIFSSTRYTREMLSFFLGHQDVT